MNQSFHATAHAVLRQHYAFWNFWLTMGSLAPAALLLCLVFATDEFAKQALHIGPNGMRMFNAGIGLFSFANSLVQIVWRPESKEVAHAHAAKHYGQHLARLTPAVAEAMRGDFPPIPPAQVTRLKRIYLQQQEALRMLESDP